MQSRWPWSHHHVTNFKMTVRAVSARSPLPPPLTALAHWLSEGWWRLMGVSLQTEVCPPPWFPPSKIKETFPSTNLASLLALEQQADRFPLLVTLWPNFYLRPSLCSALYSSWSNDNKTFRKHTLWCVFKVYLQKDVYVVKWICSVAMVTQMINVTSRAWGSQAGLDGQRVAWSI